MSHYEDSSQVGITVEDILSYDLFNELTNRGGGGSCGENIKIKKIYWIDTRLNSLENNECLQIEMLLLNVYAGDTCPCVQTIL